VKEIKSCEGEWTRPQNNHVSKVGGAESVKKVKDVEESKSEVSAMKRLIVS
jgi:hypothetical protein